ncbi:hypothetical protein DPMN_001457 [Dreissena polymorpha]|uniref:Uncharacterized protein n=1 Tax=Dreissena polymorpha TaxID=45954 RepID=A0A9D4MHB2_DREPO|nr:hypothetical protein DPMN_001457 [Dreissena polymorpha]
MTGKRFIDKSDFTCKTIKLGQARLRGVLRMVTRVTDYRTRPLHQMALRGQSMAFEPDRPKRVVGNGNHVRFVSGALILRVRVTTRYRPIQSNLLHVPSSIR